MYKVPIEIYKEIERRFKCVKPWSEAYCELYSMQNFLYMLDDGWLKETGEEVETKPEEKTYRTFLEEETDRAKEKNAKNLEKLSQPEEKPDHDKAMEIPEVPEYNEKHYFQDNAIELLQVQMKYVTNSLNAVIRYLKSNNL